MPEVLHDGLILVLGASGKLGRILHRRWRGRDDVLWQARKPGPGVDVVWHTGTAWPGRRSVRAIVALWGVVPGCGALSDNTALALAAMTLARDLGAERVLHCSSAAVYAPGRLPRREEEADPSSDYGRAKLAMERAVASWPAPPASCCLRIGNVAGADSLFAALDRPGPVTLDRFPGGHGPLRSYLGHAALARTLESLLELPVAHLPPVLNLAGDGVVDMADLVRAAGRELVWRPAPDTAIPALTLDTGALKVLCDPGPSRAGDLVADWQAGTDRNDPTETRP